MSTTAKYYLAKLREDDKILHIRYSAVILFSLSIFVSLPLSFLLTFLIGLGKEYWDHFYGSGFCYYDMLANLVGMVITIPVILLLKPFFTFLLSFTA